MKPIITWVVVADGGKLRIFENRGPGKGLIPVQGLNREDAHLRDQDIVSDKPGRSYASAGRGGSAIEPQTDPVDYREVAFAKSVAGTLEQKWSAGAYQRLIIAASPTALGNLRAALCSAVDKAIVAEVPKDLTHIPTPDIARHFETMLAV
jgi:protein required for attachment to host cells